VTSSRARTLLLVCVVAIAMTVPATPAAAHAVLEGTSPARGVTVKREPKLIFFTFSEGVEGSFGAVRVFDGSGKRVDSGDVLRPRGQKSIGIGLEKGLRDGSYTATFRVISADSHPVSGGFVFSIGAPSSPGKTVAELTAASETGRATGIGFGIARGSTYAAIALAIGSIVFLLVVWIPALGLVAGGSVEWLEASGRFARRIRRLLLVALIVGAVGEAAQIVFQGATAAGTTFWAALDRDVVREVLETRFGTAHLIACGVFAGGLVLFSAHDWVPVLRPAVVGAAGLASPPRLGRAELALLGILGAALAISPSIAGHASTQSPTGLLIPTDVLHVLAMSAWIGGLVTLVVVLPAATRTLASPDRTRLLAAVLMRFSPIALAAVITLVTTGLVQSYVHVRSVDNLIHTAFGRAVLIKMCLMVALIALGAYNRNRSLPRLRALAAGGKELGMAGLALRRALRAEVALLAVVLGVTAALVSYPPATAVGRGDGGPFAATKTLGPLELQLTVDPASAGSNTMHLYLTRARDGSQFDGTKELRVRMALPSKGIGPLKEKPTKAGPGHYVIPAADFPFGGDWQVRFTDRVSEFDQYETTFEVPID
jgi:copper transport protein